MSKLGTSSPLFAALLVGHNPAFTQDVATIELLSYQAVKQRFRFHNTERYGAFTGQMASPSRVMTTVKNPHQIGQNSHQSDHNEWKFHSFDEMDGDVNRQGSRQQRDCRTC